MTKKSIAAVAAAAMIFTNVLPAAASVPMICAAAESSASSEASSKKESKADMKELLALVKSRVDIPEGYDDFTYSKSSSSGTDSYRFNWKNTAESGAESAISVTVNEYGVITYYSIYDDVYEAEWNKLSFAKLSKEQLGKAALNALSTLNPDIAGEFVADVDDISIPIHGTDVYVRLYRENEGVRLNKNSISVTVNKNTGEFRNFSLNWWNNAKFESPSKAISDADKEAAFKKNVKLVPYYKINSDYNEKTNKYDKSAVLLYSVDNNVQFDASTGEPTKMLEDYALSYNTSRYDGGVYMDEEEIVEECADEAIVSPATGVGGSAVTFTAAEKKALMDSGRYYSKEDLIKLLKEDKYLGLTDDYMLDYSSFSKDEDSPSGYSWNLYLFVNTSKVYKGVNITADAESGKIISFSKNEDSPNKVINVKEVNKVAEAAAKYYLPDIFGEYKADENNTSDANKNEITRTVKFNRYSDDILVSGNDITVRVNSEGNVMAFGYRYDDVKLPSPQMISADEAYTKLFAQTDFNLYYDGFVRLNGEPKVYLLFELGDVYLNAKTGKLCTESGKAIENKVRKNGCPYTDISGNWAEKYITTLYDYGIRLTEEGETEFRPGDVITEREFASMIQSLSYDDVMPLMYKDYSYSKRSEYGNDPLTKAVAAKQFVLSEGGKEFAEMNSIYISPFKDVKSDREDLGYISLAYGMGVIKGDSNGCFNPDEKVSRGYAMYMIYNYIISRK